MNPQKRRHWKAEEKLQIQAFGKSLSKKEGEEARRTDSTVSEVCRRHGIGTGQFYAWEKHARQGALFVLWLSRRKECSIAERESGTEGIKAGRIAKVRDGETSCIDSRTKHGESGAKKRAIGITPYRHYSSEEKELILLARDFMKWLTRL